MDGRYLSLGSQTCILRVLVRLPGDDLAIVFWGLHVAVRPNNGLPAPPALCMPALSVFYPVGEQASASAHSLFSGLITAFLNRKFTDFPQELNM